MLHQRYDLEVQNPGGFIGSNVIIKCIIPQFVKDYVRVTSWLEEPLHNIYPTLEGGKSMNLKNVKLKLLKFLKTFPLNGRKYLQQLWTIILCMNFSSSIYDSSLSIPTMARKKPQNEKVYLSRELVN